MSCCFFFLAEDGIRDYKVTGVQTCALPIYRAVAGTVIGTDLVAKSPADGYTLLLVSTAFAINQTLYPKLPRSEERRVGKECRNGGSLARHKSNTRNINRTYARGGGHICVSG